MPTHSHQRTNHQRDTYSQICLGHRSVNVTQQAYSCLTPCNKPGRCRADLLVSLLRSSFLYLYSVFAIEIQFDPAVSGWCRLVGCMWKEIRPVPQPWIRSASQHAGGHPGLPADHSRNRSTTHDTAGLPGAPPAAKPAHRNPARQAGQITPVPSHSRYPLSPSRNMRQSLATGSAASWPGRRCALLPRQSQVRVYGSC